MRQLMHCRAVRSVCYALVVALVATIAPAPSTPARAQLMPTYSVGVGDFVNQSGVQGDLLARLATDAVVVEMGKTNRYDVSITRSQMQSQMELLDIHAPLDKVGLLRLGEALSADAMLEGAITSVQIAGSGATRRASVTLVVQMFDQASGEIINGAIQTGTSSARVGYAPDDDALLTEAISKAAFLAVKTMVDYIIPEATVQMNIGQDQVMINRGARDGLKPGMRMIILRNKEIIGYIGLTSVSATDSLAKVLKSMRGIQPEDRARAIFDMPSIHGAAKVAPVPSGAPRGGGTGKSAFSKVGKFLLGAAIVFGLVSLFKGGRGTEDAPTIGALGPMDITWDATQYGHGQNVVEYQVLRDNFSSGAAPVKALVDPGQIDAGKTNLYALYGGGAGTAVSYKQLDANPGTTVTPASWTVPGEPYGTTHTYQVRVLYKTVAGTGTTTTTTYYLTPVSNSITATAIQQVRNVDVIQPAYTGGTPPELDVTELQQGLATLQWNRKDGANVYYVQVEPVIPGTGPTWSDIGDPIYETGPTVELPAAQRIALASALANYGGVVMKWRVYCRNTGDTSQSWVTGDENRFEIGAVPPPPLP